VAQNSLKEPLNVIKHSEVKDALSLVIVTITVFSHGLKNGKSKK
jgi:hypothetical protein